MSTTLTVPAPIVGHLRCGLHSELGQAAAEIDGLSVLPEREAHPEWFEEPLRQLDAVRALLDVIGWGEPAVSEPVEVDLDRHRAALIAALAGLLEIERDLLDVDTSFEGAERQRERAGHAVSEIESFLADNDLPVPEAG